MNRLHQTFPWFLTITAVIAIALGMEASPARMQVSGAIQIDGEDALSTEVYFLADGESADERLRADELSGGSSDGTRIYLAYSDEFVNSPTPYFLRNLSL